MPPFYQVILLLCCIFIGYRSAFQIFTSSASRHQLRRYHSFASESQEPLNTNKVTVSIEYCPGCKWMLRSSWMAQEILSTFEKDVREVSLIPSEESGTFVIRVNKEKVWDRRDEATPGFPDVKELKKLVRDRIDPNRDLGHIDKLK